MTLFDRWIAVDWSAAARPTTGLNSIWIATADDRSVEVVNPATRSEAVDVLAAAGNPSERTMIAVDVSFGLPAGAADVLAPGTGPPWRRLWDAVANLVDDDERNSNNRFDAAASLNRAARGPAGPFWGHPPSWSGADLSATRPDFPWGSNGLVEYRHAEAELRARGHAVQSTWKIAYQASVGGQFLTAIGRLLELQQRRPQTRFWPFEIDDAATPAAGDTWVGELWPGEFELARAHPIRDADQVLTAAREMRRLDRAQRLDEWFRGPTDPAIAELARREEGWPWSPALSSVSPTRASGA